MSSKSETEETAMNDDELNEGSKERQEFEVAASGEIKDTRERRTMAAGYYGFLRRPGSSCFCE